MLENLAPDLLPRLLRRSAVSSLLVGVGAFAIAIFLAPPLAALGVAIGVGLALLNLRVLARQVVTVAATGDESPKSLRRRIGPRALGRLGVLTVVIVGSIWVSFPLAVGIVAGLALYQLVFVANVFRAVLAQGGVQ